MYKNPTILLGQYRPSESFLHQLDTRAKMLPVLLLLVLSLISSSVIFYVSCLVLLIAGLLISGIDFKLMTTNFKPIFIMVAIISLFHLVFTEPGSKVLLNILGWEITQEAVANAAFFSLRLILFLSVAMIITLTSSPSDIAESITKSLKPLSKLKIPVNEIGLIIFIAIRFIPVLYEEFSTIKNAQMMRGISFSGSIKTKIKRISFILIPVFLSTIRRADELADAISVRGFGKSSQRTFYSKMKFQEKEWVFTIVSSLVILLIFGVTS